MNFLSLVSSCISSIFCQLKHVMKTTGEDQDKSKYEWKNSNVKISYLSFFTFKLYMSIFDAKIMVSFNTAV